MSRAVIVLAMLVSSALLAEPAWHDNAPALLWNASASAPIGLYRLAPASPVEVGDLVVATPPAALADFLAERGYLPRGVPLLKHVFALAGATVCRNGASVIVDGHVSGTALEQDTGGRALPIWQGCRLLSWGEIFLMNVAVADSLDSRYFGPLPVSVITARALRVLTDDHGDGHFHWHIGDPAGTPASQPQPPAQELSHGTNR